MFLHHLVEIKAQTRMNTQVLQSLKQHVQSLERQVIELRSSRSFSGASSRLVSQPPAGIMLPLETIQNIEQLERRLRSSPTDMQNLVSWLYLIWCFTFYCNWHLAGTLTQIVYFTWILWVNARSTTDALYLHHRSWWIMPSICVYNRYMMLMDRR